MLLAKEGQASPPPLSFVPYHLCHSWKDFRLGEPSAQDSQSCRLANMPVRQFVSSFEALERVVHFLLAVVGPGPYHLFPWTTGRGLHFCIVLLDATLRD